MSITSMGIIAILSPISHGSNSMHNLFRLCNLEIWERIAHTPTMQFLAA